jgi:hypothetical protein
VGNCNLSFCFATFVCLPPSLPLILTSSRIRKKASFHRDRKNSFLLTWRHDLGEEMGGLGVSIPLRSLLENSINLLSILENIINYRSCNRNTDGHSFCMLWMLSNAFSNVQVFLCLYFMTFFIYIMKLKKNPFKLKTGFLFLFQSTMILLFQVKTKTKQNNKTGKILQGKEFIVNKQPFSVK